MAEDEHLEGDEEEIEKVIEKALAKRSLAGPSRTSSARAKEIELKPKPKITAHDVLIKSEEELKKEIESVPGKRETQSMLKDLKIITAIMLGKKSNKELSKVLDTDKSFTSKQIKQLEAKGLVHKTGEGKKTKYEVNEFNVMKFLTSRIVLRWGKKEEEKKKGEKND